MSLRDEIRTNGYGMAIIEILCMASVLLHIKSNNDIKYWEVCDDWEAKVFYLCMQGLSLDSHRSFQNKLMEIPYS